MCAPNRLTAGRRLLLTLAALGFPALHLAACAEAPRGPRPDVVIVLIDTLRADFLEPYGFERETSPRIASLAQESVLFRSAHAAAPWTLPSVVSLMTGRHVVEHGVVTERAKLSPRVPLLGQILRDEGYATASYHRNPFAGVKAGLERGFDVCELVRRPIDGATVVAWLQAAGERPYLLYVHNVEPHDPQRTRKPFLKSFDPVAPEFLAEYGELVDDYRSLTRVDFVRERPLGTTDNSEAQSAKMAGLTARLDEVRNLYACAVRDADDRVGSIVDALKASGRWDRTMLVVLSDHGEELGDHGGWQHDQSLYQELVHVPLLVKLPGGAHAGKVIDTPVSLVDLLPTVLEVARVKPPKELAGRSLLELCRASRPPAPRPRIVAMRANERKFYRPYKEARGDRNVAVRWGDWKAIHNLELGTLELYDLASDPLERRDLARERPDVAEKLLRFATEGYAELSARAFPTAPQGGLDPEVQDAIRDLGYIGGEDE